MFRIGEFSRLSGVSVRMLRHYDKMELLVPERVDELTGYRYYTAGQLARAGKIQGLKDLGFSLAVVREMLDSAKAEDLEKFFSIREKELQEELAKVVSQSQLLARAVEIMKEDADIMQYNVVLKEIPERKVMSLRRVIPSYSDEGMLWQELYAESQRQNVKFDNPPLGVSVYHDEEYKDHDVDVEIQSSVKGDYTDAGEVRFYTAPAVQVASVTFNGGYDQMTKVFEAIGRWMEDNRYAMNGPMFNIFHVSPAQDPNPENWVTEACYQVVAQP